MKENSILRAVREGRAALGTGLKEFASRGVPWIIEAAGFDYCAIDHEHGVFDMETIAKRDLSDAALRELHQSLQHRPAEDEVERRRLSRALLPHVRRFYAGYFDPEAQLPYYRTSSRR